MTAGQRVRQLANAVNTSTLLGLGVAKVGGADLRSGPEGLVIAEGYGLRVPPAPAFTVGNVVVLRRTGTLERRPTLLRHEARHATQWAWCLGPLFLLLYALASLWSWLVAGNPATRNVFERLAGLEDGGYRTVPGRPGR